MSVTPKPMAMQATTSWKKVAIGAEIRRLTLGASRRRLDTRQKAEVELENILADVRRGSWQRPEPERSVDEPRPEPTFHEFASEWLEARRHELG